MSRRNEREIAVRWRFTILTYCVIVTFVYTVDSVKRVNAIFDGARKCSNRILMDAFRDDTVPDISLLEESVKLIDWSTRHEKSALR